MATILEIAEKIRARKASHEGQFVVALAGPPASGKSTLANDLLMELKGSIILAMDGFHLDNGILTDRGILERKGSPESFDLAGFSHLLERINAGEEVVAPIFDRNLDLSRAGAVAIGPEHDVVIVEGNYLLLRDAPWSELHRFWDMTISLNVPLDVLKERLVHRWLGQDFGVERAHAKAQENDLPNAELVVNGSIEADLVVDTVEI